MRKPLYIRPLTDADREEVNAGLRSADAFMLRRSQILLASARGQRVPQIAQYLGCDEQTVRNVIHAFNPAGPHVLTRQSKRPQRIYRAFEAEAVEGLKRMVHQSPRVFGPTTRVWTLDLVAEVSVAEGLTAQRVSGETVRATLQRLGIRWQRAKHWITSPDPGYARKKTARPADASEPGAS